MVRYVFKDGPVILKNAEKANPQKIGEALAKLTQQHSGRLEPEFVVSAAKDTKSPLHPHFEWNDKVAAHAYRMDQARAIISLIRVDEGDGKPPKPAYLSVADNGVSYRSVKEVETSRDLQLIVLRQAERDLRAFENRYHMLADICETVRTAREGIERKRAEIETRAAA